MARSRREFDYQLPSYEETVERAERKGGTYDNILKDCKVFVPKQGSNVVRILPPTWSKARHYGYQIFVHGNVGPNDRRYLCLKENLTSPHKRCPVCEELYNLGPSATREEKNVLRPKMSFIYYVIDRLNEKDGVQVWTLSPTNDSEIAAQSTESRTRRLINIVDLDNGYDIEYTRTGQGLATRYRGFKVMREPSPLADSDKDEDGWLDHAFEKPLPTLLQFYSPEYIEGILYGKAKVDEDDRPVRSRLMRDDDEDSLQPRRTSIAADETRPIRSRQDASEEDEDERPVVRRERRVTVSKEDEPLETGRRAGPRTELQEELDDEIPFDREPKSNGHDDAPTRARRAAPDREPEDRPASSRRRIIDEDADEVEIERPARRTDADRARLRDRVNRGDD